jgi:hypothetical protein
MRKATLVPHLAVATALAPPPVAEVDFWRWRGQRLIRWRKLGGVFRQRRGRPVGDALGEVVRAIAGRC